MARDPFAAYAVSGKGLDPFSEFEVAPAAPESLPPRVPPARELFGPEATTRRAMRAIPFVTGALGAVAVRSPRGAGIGATVGRGLLSMLGAGAGGAGGRAGERALAGEPISTRDVLAGGGEQALLQGPAAALGVLGRAGIAARAAGRARATRQLIEPARVARAAERDVLERELKQATAERRFAAERAGEARRASQEIITIGDIARPIARAEGKKLSVVASEVRQAIREAVPPFAAERIGRPFPVNKVAFTPEEADIIKRAFQHRARQSFVGEAAGRLATPSRDRLIARSARQAIEARVPNMQVLNASTQKAIQRVQSLTGAVETIRKAAPRVPAREAAAVARMLSQRSPNPLTIIRGVPLGGPFVKPRVAFAPGTLSELSGVLGEAALTPLARRLAFLTPRSGAALLRLLEEEEALQP